jgi:hypothetical protein
MMRSVAAAAGGQARVLTGFERGRKRAQAEDEYQKDGKRAPHLKLILQQNERWVGGKRRRLSFAAHRLNFLAS